MQLTKDVQEDEQRIKATIADVRIKPRRRRTLNGKLKSKYKLELITKKLYCDIFITWLWLRNDSDLNSFTNERSSSSNRCKTPAPDPCSVPFECSLNGFICVSDWIRQISSVTAVRWVITRYATNLPARWYGKCSNDRMKQPVSQSSKLHFTFEGLSRLLVIDLSKSISKSLGCH